VTLSHAERAALEEAGELLPFALTPYYLSLVDPDDPTHPIRRTVIPTAAELHVDAGEQSDPLGEDAHSPVPGLVHRYPDRVLFLVTQTCASYCRYCTRSRRVGDEQPFAGGRSHWSSAISYIRDHPEVRDVLLSGGDPLTLTDDVLESLLRRLREIPHVEIIRIGTKTPAVLPMRITRSLVTMLRRYHPLYVSIHATHPDELTPQMVRACTRLANGGIPLGSQTVLLKGINDTVPVMKELMHRLLMARVRPYYIYQCDPILGSAHFRTPVATGLEIIRGLRGHTSGYAVPTYVIDAPGGGGKIPLLPDYVVGYDGNDLVLRNYEGREFCYPGAR
jgi:lysine 2,3-aminomutase